nr:MAG TPA: hypothetical protein [Caudoviricetes sp.]
MDKKIPCLVRQHQAGEMDMYKIHTPQHLYFIIS